VNLARRPALRILSIHRVIDASARLSVRDRQDLDRGCLSLQQFKAALRYLRKCYRLVSLADAVEALARPGAGAPPRNAVALTFDDGFRDVAVAALPHLLAEAVPFTLFLTTGWTGSDPLMMNADEVKEVRDRAGSLASWGAHGVTHRALTDLPPAEAEAEILKSRDDVAALTGVRPRLFCYPEGRLNETVRGLVKRAGFMAACATGRRLNVPPVDLFSLQRIPLESEPLGRFAFRIAGRT
jgi:peptidoglycan/xylan/chitin deacetylase (PgdA/CDA1 family)